MAESRTIEELREGAMAVGEALRMAKDVFGEESSVMLIVINPSQEVEGDCDLVVGDAPTVRVIAAVKAHAAEISNG